MANKPRSLRHSDLTISLVALLKQIRLETGTRQVDLCKALNVPQSYVSNYESGIRRLDILELRQVCHELEINLPDFVKRLEKAFAEDEDL